VAADAPDHDLIAHVLWRCALAQSRAGDARALAVEAQRLLAQAEFPWLSIVALTAAVAAADDGAEAERLLRAARTIAAAKGDRAGLTQLDAARV
jgi:hypothetical protein